MVSDDPGLGTDVDGGAVEGPAVLLDDAHDHEHIVSRCGLRDRGDLLPVERDGRGGVPRVLIAPLLGALPQGRAEGEALRIRADHRLGQHRETCAPSGRIGDEVRDLPCGRRGVEGDGSGMDDGDGRRAHAVLLGMVGFHPER